MSHSPTLLMMQCHLCHLWLFQPPRQVRPTSPHPCCLHTRLNLSSSVHANVINRRLPVNSHRNLCLLSPKCLPSPLSDPMPSPISATSGQPGVQLFTMSFAPANLCQTRTIQCQCQCRAHIYCPR